MKYIFSLILMLIFSYSVSSQNQLIKDISVVQCDSLIQANENNPLFVVLDVRTPKEYDPSHIRGAITRNFYDADFNDQLDLMNKDKLYLIHCQSGGRSGSALNAMKSLGFKEVYNMLGGMGAWKRKSLPTTDKFAPRIMFITDSIIDLGEVNIGDIDTTIVTITNRANDLLKLNSLSHSGGDEFTTDFDSTIILEGAEDYSFNIFFEPNSVKEGEVIFNINSNAGELELIIDFNVLQSTSTKEEIGSNIIIYPNPASDVIMLKGVNYGITQIEIVNMNGQIVKRQSIINPDEQIPVTSLNQGSYFINVYSKKHQLSSSKLLIVK